MKRSSYGILSLIALITLCGCASPKINKVTSSDSIYIRKIENLSDNFYMGMDVSSLISLENSGVRYYDFDQSVNEDAEMDLQITLDY